MLRKVKMPQQLNKVLAAVCTKWREAGWGGASSHSGSSVAQGPQRHAGPRLHVVVAYPHMVDVRYMPMTCSASEHTNMRNT